MSSSLPLLMLDTNILMDIWLERGESQAPLFLDLHRTRRIDLMIPEYVLLEFRGTAHLWVQKQRVLLKGPVLSAANEWSRSKRLDSGAAGIKDGCRTLETELNRLKSSIAEVERNIRASSQIVPHTLQVHFQGDLRFLSGRPPDRAVDGLKDCRIYEAILSIAVAETERESPKCLLTKDSDFDYQELKDELLQYGVTMRKDSGKLYAELR